MWKFCEFKGRLSDVCVTYVVVFVALFHGPWPTALGDDQTRRIENHNYLNDLGVDLTTTGVKIPRTARLSDSDLLRLLDAGHVTGIYVQCASLTADGIVAYLDKVNGLSTIVWEGPGVTDEVIAAIARQESLTHLSLRGPFRGDGLASFFNRPVSKTLRYLSLRPERFQRKGEFGWKFGLTTKAISTIGSFKILQELSLADCGIPDERLRHIAGLTELETLELDGNPINGSGLMWLKELDVLDRLNLSFCRLSDHHLVEFPSLPSLQTLHLSGNQIGSLAVAKIAAAETPELQYLYLSRTDMTDEGLSCLTGVPKLRNLHLEDTRVNGSGLGVLSELPIKVVNLAWAPVEPEALDTLANFSQLGSLKICGAPLNDDHIPALKRFRHLRFLSVARTGISKQGVDELRRHFPESRITTEEWISEIWEVHRPGGRLPTECAD